MSWLVHSEILSFQTCKTFVHLRNTNEDIFDEILRAFWLFIDSNATDKFLRLYSYDFLWLCSNYDFIQQFFLFLWYAFTRVPRMRQEKKLHVTESLNKVVIFVFFAHKKYSRSFIKLRLNHWCPMDYFNDVLTTFLGLERGSCSAVYGGSESSRISSKISSFVFRRFHLEVKCVANAFWMLT